MKRYEEIGFRTFDDFFKIRDLQQSAQVLLPLFDRHGDQLSVYIEKGGDSFTISDDGYFMNDLDMSDVCSTGEKWETIERFCAMNSIRMIKDELTKSSAPAQIVIDLYSFGKIILQIEDLCIDASLYIPDRSSIIS